MNFLLHILYMYYKGLFVQFSVSSQSILYTFLIVNIEDMVLPLSSTLVRRSCCNIDAKSWIRHPFSPQWPPGSGVLWIMKWQDALYFMQNKQGRLASSFFLRRITHQCMVEYFNMWNISLSISSILSCNSEANKSFAW